MAAFSSFQAWAGGLAETGEMMPVLFMGHGNPMNAIEDNIYHRKWQQLGKELPKPSAILCVSAHWLTRGTYITAMEKPKTIHDFGGFPQELFDVQYPAPGFPKLADEVAAGITAASVGKSQDWGLDHGCWSVIMPMYPQADIPVLQFSIDYTRPPQYHYELGKQLAALRKKGVLIIGSGNIVHNLGLVNFSKTTGEDWAVSFNEKIKAYIRDRDHAAVINYTALGREAQLSVPTNEHYLPLIYALALQQDKDEISFFNDETLMGSLSMTSVLIRS